MDSIIPPEVVEMIFSNLGKSDLLNCRLVSHFWNKECLKHLRKSKFTQQLRKSSIKTYMEFIKSNNQPQFVLPFCIDIGADICDEMKIHKMNEFTKHLTLLINLFGPECVIGLRLILRKKDWIGSGSDIDINWLVQLFKMTSVGLKMLDFSCLDCCPEQRDILIKTVGILRHGSTHFPNLKKLKLDTYFYYVPIIQFFYENSPNLQKLKMSKGYIRTILSVPISFERLKTLKLARIDDASDLQGNAQKLHSFPVLQKLKLGVTSSLGIEKEIFHNFFTSVSETIKSLTIILSGEDRPVLMLNFPKFPQLHNLKIILESSYPLLPVYFNALDLYFNQEIFPVLKAIEFPVGCVFLTHCLLDTLTPDVCTSTCSLNSIFSNIQHLTLNVHHSHSFQTLNIISYHPSCIMHDWNMRTSQSEFSNLSAKLVENIFYKNVEGLQSIFPNVTDIVIVDKCIEDKQHMHELIKELIQCNRASVIRNFTLRNCEQDYLGQVLSQLSYQPCVGLENLKKSPEFEQTNEQDVSKNMTDSSYVISTSRNVLNTTKPKKKTFIVEENTSAVNNYMKHVNKLKFEYSRVDEDGRIRSIKKGNMPMTVSMLDIKLIVKEFPNLCQIAISSLLFDQDQQKRSEQIDDVRIQFPNITINII